MHGYGDGDEGGDGHGDGLLQAIKQKLHMRSRLTEEPPVTDVQEEQDKAKMLLGAKLLVSGWGAGWGGWVFCCLCMCVSMLVWAYFGVCVCVCVCLSVHVHVCVQVFVCLCLFEQVRLCGVW